MADDELRCPKKGCRGHLEPSWPDDLGVDYSSGFLEAGPYAEGSDAFSIEQDVSLYHCTACGTKFAVED